MRRPRLRTHARRTSVNSDTVRCGACCHVVTRLFFLSFLFLPLLCEAKLLYEEKFTTETAVVMLSNSGWLAYTNDDSSWNGWTIADGVLIQGAINGDKEPGGERLLARPKVLHAEATSSPIDIYCDVFPFDYKGTNDCWWGFELFVDAARPDAGAIVVALRRDISRGMMGLHVAVSGWKWIVEGSGLEVEIGNWYRIHARLENFQPNKSVQLRARAWKLGESEPEKWQADIGIAGKEVKWGADGVALGCNALWSALGNPRALFDNLRIYSGEHLAREDVFKKTPDELFETAMVYLDARRYEDFILRAERLRKDYPDFAGMDDVEFHLMLGLRELKQWEQARAKANEIIRRFPKSPYTKRMGGLDGRTEDEAAVAFAGAMRFYGEKQFSEARRAMLQFLTDFPNNWRRETAEYYAVRSLYDERHDDPNKLIQFLGECSEILTRSPRGPYADDLLAMQVAALIRSGKPEQARDVLKYLEENFPNSERRDEYPRLWMDTYLNSLVFKKEDVQNVKGLEHCYDYAERFIAEGHKDLTYKYADYCARFSAATKDSSAVEAGFERLESYARNGKESMLPWLLVAKSDYYWNSQQYERSVEAAKEILNSDCPVGLRDALVQRIAGHMARSGVERTQISAFLDQYRR